MSELRLHMKPLVQAALGECFKATFNSAEKALFQQAKQTGHEDDRQAIFAALTHLKQHRDEFESQTLARLEDPELPEQFTDDWAAILDDRGLGLQVEDMLSAARSRYGIEHAQFEARLQWMRQRDAEAVPEGLYTLQAITTASLLSLADFPDPARRAMLKAFGTYLLGKLEPLYVLLNDFLVQAGVLTRVRSIRPQGAAANINQFKSAIAHQPTLSEMPEVQNLGSDQLRERLDRLTLDARDTILLDQLDNWTSERFLRAIQDRLQANGANVRIEAMAQEIIKLVGILFSGILNDEKVAANVRRQILRLQWPVVRVALEDRNFFRQANHPARDVLNLCALIGSDPSTDSQTIHALARVVQEISDNHRASTAVFAAARDQLKQLERAADSQWLEEDRRAAQARHAAMLERCRERVKATIEAQSANITLLPEAKRFLREIWGPLMVMVLLNYGRQSQAWADAMRLLDRALALQADPEVSRRDVLAFSTQANEALELANMLPEQTDNALTMLVSELEQRARRVEKARAEEIARAEAEMARRQAEHVGFDSALEDEPESFVESEELAEPETAPVEHAEPPPSPVESEPVAPEEEVVAEAAPEREALEIAPMEASDMTEEPLIDEPVETETAQPEAERGQQAIDEHEPEVVSFIETHLLNDEWFEVFTADGAALRRLKGKSLNTELGVVNFANRMGELALFVPLAQLVEDLIDERTRPVFENPAFTRALTRFRERIGQDRLHREDGQDD